MTETLAVELALSVCQAGTRVPLFIKRVKYNSDPSMTYFPNAHWSVLIGPEDEFGDPVVVDDVTGEIWGVTKWGHDRMRPPDIDPGLPYCEECKDWIFPERNRFVCQHPDVDEICRRLDARDVAFFEKHNVNEGSTELAIGVYQCTGCSASYVTVLQSRWPIAEADWRDVQRHVIDRKSVV